jgi:hypothetical protein
MAAVAARMPSPLTPFVGRTVERTVLAEALGAHRLVTAVGPGGVGKTRLALRVVADIADRFADGAWFVDLVPVTDSSMIAPAIAEAIGVGEHQSRSPEETIVNWLADRETLLGRTPVASSRSGCRVARERSSHGRERAGPGR